MEKQKLKTGDLIKFNQGMDKGVIALFISLGVKEDLLILKEQGKDVFHVAGSHYDNPFKYGAFNIIGRLNINKISKEARHSSQA
jgi:hypothetical protein